MGWSDGNHAGCGLQPYLMRMEPLRVWSGQESTLSSRLWVSDHGCHHGCGCLITAVVVWSRLSSRLSVSDHDCEGLLTAVITAVGVCSRLSSRL